MNSDLEKLVAPPSASGAFALAPSRILETIVIRFLARVVHADGHIDPKEVSMMSEIAQQLGMGVEEAKKILDDELTRKSDVAKLATQIPDRIRQREVYAMGCLIGYADGGIDDSEKRVLGEYARGAAIPERDATEILDAIVEAAKSIQS